jgi:hypothetical protein
MNYDGLALDLAAFVDEHRDCGRLNTGFSGEPERMWLACSCGARIERQAAPRG